MLQAHIDTFLSKEDFGYLPPNLCMMGLVGQMNKNARARVRDVTLGLHVVWYGNRTTGRHLCQRFNVFVLLKCIVRTSLGIVTPTTDITVALLTADTTVASSVARQSPVMRRMVADLMHGNQNGLGMYVTVPKADMPALIIIVTRMIPKSRARRASAVDTLPQIVIC
jgi:hypothetical protein